VPTATTAPVSGVIKKVCFITDHEPDSGFNQIAWNGVQAAVAQYGGEAAYLVASEPEAFEKTVSQFLPSGCDLIMTLGFLHGDAAAAAAKANPRQKFQMLDAAYDPPIGNVWAQVYATDQGAFLAGYLAASVTKTGKVGTFGGFRFPSVEAFMDGFALGVAYHNQKNGTEVKVIGWDVASREGYFTDDFGSFELGMEMGDRLLNEGADVIFPVAGFTGQGAAEAVRARGNAYVIGVDNDWAADFPDYAKITLTSVEKRLNLSVIAAVQAIAEGMFEGGTYIGTVANGEVGLSPFYDLDKLVSEKVKADLIQVKYRII